VAAGPAVPDGAERGQPALPLELLEALFVGLWVFGGGSGVIVVVVVGWLCVCDCGGGGGGNWVCVVVGSVRAFFSVRRARAERTRTSRTDTTSSGST
jgi:hypothetical protein